MKKLFNNFFPKLTLLSILTLLVFSISLSCSDNSMSSGTFVGNTKAADATSVEIPPEKNIENEIVNESLDETPKDADTKPTAPVVPAGKSKEPPKVEIADLCDKAKQENNIETLVQTVTFEATQSSVQCPFGMDDNLDVRDGFITARIHQKSTVDFNIDKTLCAVEFDFGVFNTEHVAMVTDDVMFFTVGSMKDNAKTSSDYIIASTFDFSAVLMKENNLLAYDWLKFRNSRLNPNIDADGIQNNAPYCIESTSGSCSIPGHDSPGPFSIFLSDAISYKLSELFKNSAQLEFGFIVTGDNDNATDCQHDKPFLFDIKLSYVK